MASCSKPEGKGTTFDTALCSNLSAQNSLGHQTRITAGKGPAFSGVTLLPFKMNDGHNTAFEVTTFNLLIDRKGLIFGENVYGVAGTLLPT